VNIVHKAYWGLEDELTASTVFPHLSISAYLTEVKLIR
jgi:hypothetical protein